MKPILIIDDDWTTRTVLSQLLKGAGFKTLCAHDLLHAEALVREHDIGLILLDVHLPDGDGIDFCARLHTLPRTEGTPVLLISADHDISVKVRGFDAGAVDYITKPISGPEVLARVRTHLRLRAATERLISQQEARIRKLAVSQRLLMPNPSDFPEARFEICVRQRLRAGGDFCDVIPSGEGITDYLVADVSGHDLGSSLWTAAFKALLSEYASPLYAPKDICQKLNTSMRRLLPETAYITAIYARINRSINKIILVNAGHPPAIHVRAATGTASTVEQQGDVLGMFSDSIFGMDELTVKTGDRLFLYSDGLVEISGNRSEGIRRLLEMCSLTLRDPLKKAVPAIVEHLCPAAADDDIVLLGTEI